MNGEGSHAERVLSALVDTTRRHILDTLAARGEMTGTALAAEMPVSRQAVVKHIAILSEAGLVCGRRIGREVLYAIQPDHAQSAATWLADLATRWSDRLERIKRLAEYGDGFGAVDGDRDRTTEQASEKGMDVKTPAIRLRIAPPRDDRSSSWLRTLWQLEWGGDVMVSRGHAYRLADVQALVAERGGEFVGAATYRMDSEAGCELMSINATASGNGVGTALLRAVEAVTVAAGCERVWLITSNDNLDALRFYQRCGYRITAVHAGAIDEARSIKPGIPLVGVGGIEIHDEIELAKRIGGSAAETEKERRHER